MDEVYKSVEVVESEIVAGKTNAAGIILRPQPTNDPNEPLNWPGWEKYTTYGMILWGTALSFMNSSSFAVVVPLIKDEFSVGGDLAAYLTSFQVLAMGFGPLVSMPLARIIGKRPSYLIALFFLSATNAWGFFSPTYGDLLASRILSGFLTSVMDAPVSGVVAELFFHHQRGTAMMWFVIALASGVCIGQLINSFIAEYAGWRWMCGVMAIASGASLVPALLLLRETAYVMPERDMEKTAAEYPPKKGWVASLSLTSGYDKDASFFTWVSRTICILAYPPVFVTGLTGGLYTGGTIAMSISAAEIFTRPPWNWPLHKLGLLLGLAGFIGAVLAYVIGGPIIDWIAVRMAARNAQRAEPEFRLPAMLLAAILAPLGMLIFFFVGGNEAGTSHWAWIALAFAIKAMGGAAATNMMLTYVIDGYRQLAGETMVVVFIVRNGFACVLSSYMPTWIKQAGFKVAYGEFIGVSYGILLLSLVLYVYGKRIRHWTYGFGPMATALNG